MTIAPEPSPTPYGRFASRPFRSDAHSRLPVFRVDSPVYERLDGAVPVSFPSVMETLAGEVRRHIEAGLPAMAEVFDVEPLELYAILAAESEWDSAPRDNERPYPPGFPYFTRSTDPPTLVLPEKLSSAIRPRTEATLPLTVWHELAHAFILRNPVVKTPAWLREFIPQTASAAVAKRERLPLEEHFGAMDRPEFTARTFRSPASAEEQMAFQNLLLRLGAAAIGEFGEGFLRRLVHALWKEEDIVGEERAEAMLAESLGDGCGAWLEGREEF
ncbi:MAG: hypothetical protein H0U65_11000 [Rubrobacter sp.]|nr:hypothetical protein [Rubrobacter sp.]